MKIKNTMQSFYYIGSGAVLVANFFYSCVIMYRVLSDKLEMATWLVWAMLMV